MITFLYIFGFISLWIITGMAAYKIGLKAGIEDEGGYIFASVMTGPIGFIFSIFYYLFLKKNPPPINGYKWGDLVEYEGKRAIVVGPLGFSTNNRLSIIQEHTNSVTHIGSEEVSPIISGEMKDTLEYVNAVNEFEKATNELEEKANKVQSMRSKVKTIFDKQ